MDKNAEYHDPDYPEAAVCIKEEKPSISEEEKVAKIKEIIRREFLNELKVRENEVILIDQRLTSSRRLLHRLRYVLVSSYYKEQKLQLTNGQIQDDIAAQQEPRSKAVVTSLLRDGQRRLHPSVRRLLGKKTVDLSDILVSRSPRSRARKDYTAMLQKRNYTISADTTKTLRPDRKPDIGCLSDNALQEEPCTSRPRKIPRHLEPKVNNVVTLDEVTRNKMKYRYRIVIGNTSKYVPPASRADRSTHKWLLYIRGPPHAPDISPLVTAVTIRLHHSYAPHHTVHIDKPPFHISRRGWGEFPAKIELHFVMPERNRPATVEHNIKLDRNYTGLQMLGSETLVDVWLYSTQDMIQYEFKEDTQTEIEDPLPVAPEIKTEPDPEPEPEPTPIFSPADPIENYDASSDYWMELFSRGPSEVDVDEMIIKPIKKETAVEPEKDLDAIIDSNIIPKTEKVDPVEEDMKEEKFWGDDYASLDSSDIPTEILSQPTSPKKRIVKYIDPTTGKIYYLEMDRTLDLNKVQEIVINNKPTKICPVRSNGLKSVRKKKSGVSLLKPEVKSMLKTEATSKNKILLSHIENDHCYLASPVVPEMKISLPVFDIKKEKSLYGSLCAMIGKFNNVRAAVNYLVKRIPLISCEVRDVDFLRQFPFVVESEDKYWKLDFAKRRNIEWSRANLIYSMLIDHFGKSETIWHTKQILLYCRLHGHYPVRNDNFPASQTNDSWSSWTDLEQSRNLETQIREFYSDDDITTLTKFSIREKQENLSEVIDLSDDEDVDVVSCDVRPRTVKREAGIGGRELTSLPVEDEEDRLRYMYIEKKCSDVALELRNEDVGNGYSYSAVHAVLLSSMKSFVEEMTRSALAARLAESASQNTLPSVWSGSSSSRVTVNLEHVLGGVINNSRLQLLSRDGLAALKKNTHSL